MDRVHENMLSAITSEYGPTETVKSLAACLRTWADQFSDERLKDLAIEYAEMADKLEAVIK